MQLGALTLVIATPGVLGAELVPHLILVLPPLAIGTALGLVCFGRVGTTVFRQAVLSVIVISGLGLVFP